MTSFDGFKIRKEELSKLNVSTLEKCPQSQEMVVKMSQNQKKLSKTSPIHPDLLHTSSSSRFLGDVCTMSKYCNPDNFDWYKCVDYSGLYDWMDSYQYKYDVARKIQINAKIHMCEKYSLEKCYNFEFLPSENNKIGLHEYTALIIANPGYDLKSNLLKGMFVKK